MAHEHPSGLPRAYDRSGTAPSRARLIWQEGVFVQGADLNEIQSLEARRNRRVGNMVARDGDRVEGGEIFVDLETGTVTVASGRIFVAGDVRPVVAAELQDVPLTGETYVGVKLQRTLVTHEDDPSLLGLDPGTWAEGEPGAAREHEVIVWAKEDDDQEGDFYPVYLILDGTVIDQKAPPALQGILAAIAIYDRSAHGHYIVSGCEVTAMGKIGTEQIFAIQAGEANIQGWKRVREHAIRYAEEEEPDLENIAAELSTYTAATGDPNVVTVLRPPIAGIQSAIVVKRVTEVVVRGAVPGGLDALQHSSVVAVESVVQGGTTYLSPTSWSLSGGQISWAGAGAEPAAASTYNVTYLYNDAVTPTAVTDTTLTVAGGVNGQPVLVTYTSKLPRIDLMCLDIDGLPVYVKGLSARKGARAPIAPSTLLKLAEVRNTWLAKPTIVNDGVHNFTYEKMARYFGRLITMLEQFDRSEAERDILAREPVSKNGIFTDTFIDDFYRDQGVAQTAAIVGGSLTLAVDPILIEYTGADWITLDYDEEILIRQDLATSGMKINPYANFVQMPAGVTLEPAVDFWTVQETEWTSPVTQEFMAAPNLPPGQEMYSETLSERQEIATYLRQIDVVAIIEGFGVGENLQTLTFDGVNVKPPGTQTADSNGVIQVTFAIPALMPVGVRRVRAEGAAGSFGEALFVGEGVIDVSVMRRVTLITRAAPPPPPPPPPGPPPPPPPTPTKVVRPVVKTSTVIIRPENQGNRTSNNSNDPLAQTFSLAEPRHVIGVNFKFTAIGTRSKGVRVQLCTVLNGYPTNEVLAEDFINMQTPQVGDLVEARFEIPVFLTDDREYAFVFMSDDNTHALAVARLGDVDQATQTFVSAQPYTVGVLFSSSNRQTWTAHQDADLFLQIVGAAFDPTTKSVDLWTGDFEQISDVMVRAGVEIPTAEARCRFELELEDGTVIELAPDQVHEFSEFIEQEATLRAVLTGTTKISPILYPWTQLIGGKIRTTGTYITRLFPMGTAIKVATLFAAWLPAGSSVSVDVDAGNNTWSALSAAGTGTLGSGWTEPRYEKNPYTAAEGRVRLTLNGGPAARLSLARLRAYSV